VKKEDNKDRSPKREPISPDFEQEPEEFEDKEPDETPSDH
jgi:hypothetical protein